MTTPYIDPNLIFAENAPVQDKPAAFGSYDRGWDASRNNDGRPTIKQSNFLQQQNDLKNRYIHENGAALPYKDGVVYEENAVVVKDGVLQQWKTGAWVVIGDDKLSKSSNLSDIQDAAAARTNLGLGTAATREVGTSAGNVMEVGAFGFGGSSRYTEPNPAASAPVSQLDTTQMYSFSDASIVDYGDGLAWSVGNKVHFLIGGRSNGQLYHVAVADKNATPRTVGYHLIRTAQNTTVDSNGFIKNASPIVQLFADKIELNDEAQQQNIDFEKLGVGDYLVKGSSGFAQDGWYIETPKDANGNLLVAVVYEQIENGDISVKTYDYMLNNKGRIVADTETPLDIPETRWIDLRLQELPSNSN